MWRNYTAPFLRHDAPTTRTNAGGWARPYIKRTIGLSIVNGFGIRWLNGLDVIANMCVYLPLEYRLCAA